MKRKGVDISGPIAPCTAADLKAAGVEFVICKTGFGSDYPGQQDSGFAANVKLLDAAGIPWGAYHFSYATTRNGGIQEARHMLRLLNGRKPLYGVWFDMEANSTLGGDLPGAAEGFCETMEAAGLYVGVYASTSWWQNYLTSPVFDKYDKWVAQYYKECEYQGSYGIWQYTNSWVIGGRNFDGNWAYKDYPSMIKAMNGETKPEPEPEEEKELTEAQVKTIAKAAAREEIEAYFQELAAKPVSSWAKEAVEFVQKEGLMNGDADGQFRPQSNVTRQELAAVLKNLSGTA